MFDYPVMTEENANKERYSLLNDGEYHATIKKCSSRMASSGNNMFEIELDVYDDQGRINQIKDYWVFTKKMMWKIVHGCDSAGVLTEYEEKKLCPELLVNLNVRVKIVTQEGNAIPPEKLNGKPLGTCYPTKNAVEDYIKRADFASNGLSPMPKVRCSDIPFSDDVPF